MASSNAVLVGLPMKFRLLTVLALACVIALCAGVASTAPPSPAGADISRSLAAHVPDGFTLAAVGDIQLTHPVSRLNDSGFQAALHVLHHADVAVGNLETTLFDPRHFKSFYPQETHDSLRPIGEPAVAQDLKAMGLSLVSRANNHATDWSVFGMQETDRLLDAAGLTHAGTGTNRAEARSARYLDTPSGRIAFVSITATFENGESALPPLGLVPGRAGASTLRTTRIVLIDHQAMLAVRRILAAQQKGSAEPPERNTVELFGTTYQESKSFGFHYIVDAVDEHEFLHSIRQGKLNSDFLVVNMHTHEPGNWSDEPADFLPPLAHAAIDAGADEIVCEGPHHLRGIEIYKGKPIFYSLGNFIIQFAPQEPVAEDMYEKLMADPETTTDPEMIESRIGVHVEQQSWYDSVIAVTQFLNGQTSKVRLYPIDLALGARMADRGIPHLTTGAAATRILGHLAALSRPFGTRIDVSGDTGTIDARPTSRGH